MSQETPIATGSWPLPRSVVVEDGQLHWKGWHRERRAELAPELLDDFLTLEDSSDDEIGAFANRWGLLNMDATWVLEEGAQDTDLWRDTSRFFGAVLAIASDEHANSDTDFEKWAVLDEFDFVKVAGDTWDTFRVEVLDDSSALKSWAIVDEPHSALARIISRCLERTSVGIHLDWVGQRPQLGVTTHTLDAGLAFQLALTTARADQLLSVCSSCSMFFVPKRKPAAGRASYCQACGDRARWRLADERRRLKKAEGKR